MENLVRRRHGFLHLNVIGCKAEPGELPALVALEEIPVGRPDVCSRGGTRAAAKHHLVDHELSIILSQRSAQPAFVLKYEARRRLELCVGLLPVDRVPVIDPGAPL